jgi:hypothetical protein
MKAPTYKGALCATCAHAHPGRACDQCHCSTHTEKHPQGKIPAPIRPQRKRKGGKKT